MASAVLEQGLEVAKSQICLKETFKKLVSSPQISRTLSLHNGFRINLPLTNMLLVSTASCHGEGEKLVIISKHFT